MSAVATTGSSLSRLRDEVRQRVLAGQQAVALSVLSANPSLASDAERAADLIAEEYAALRERGDAPAPSVWLLQHSAWSAPLRRRLRALGVETPTEQTSHPTYAWRRTRPSATEQELPPLPALEDIVFVKRGGMGRVFKARDKTMQRTVALKTLDTGPSSSAERVRFCREARAAGSLDHPNILKIHALGIHKGEHAFTMPFCEGGSLADRLMRGPLPFRDAALIVERVARAAHFAHEAGIIHRDIKPGNILFADDPLQPLLADFGLARIGAGEELTRTGAAMGTAAYMAPEQARGARDAGPAADVWAIGVVLHEAATGRRPAEGSGSSRSAISSRLPPGLAAIVQRCLAPLPEGRFASAGDLADAIARWLDGEAMPVQPPPPPGRKGRAALSLTLLAGLLSLLAALPASPEPEPVEKKAWSRWAVNELKAGRAVTLLGPEGVPPRCEWRIEKNRPLPAPDLGPLWLTGWQPTQLELSPGLPLERLKIRAEVAFASGTHPAAACGIYVGEESGNEFDSYVLGLAPSRSGSMVAVTGPFHFRTRTATVGQLRYFEDRRRAPVPALAGAMGLLMPIQHPAQLSSLPWWAGHGAPGRFHVLELEIAAGSLRATVDGAILDEVKGVEGAAWLDLWWRMANLARKPLPARPSPTFGPTSRVGLYLTDGAARFRNVRLLP